MADVGDRFQTGMRCETSGTYTFDGYVDGRNWPGPSEGEEAILMRTGELFPAVQAANRPCWRTLTTRGS
jgi:hypothetical protein